MTKEFEEGMAAFDIGLLLLHNPYVSLDDERHKEWENGWKLEKWRLKNRAEREEADRQIHID